MVVIELVNRAYKFWGGVQNLLDRAGVIISLKILSDIQRGDGTLIEYHSQ
jgi:hypothetical protein